MLQPTPANTTFSRSSDRPLPF